MHKSIMLYGIILIMVFAVSFTYAVEEGDIVVYYSFDRLDGSKFVDDSGNGYDAELTGSGKLVDGQFSKAVHLDGGCCEFRAMVNPASNPFWDAGHHADKSLGNFKFEAQNMVSLCISC